MPRSLASCYENLEQNLDRIGSYYGRQGPAQRQARSTRTKLQNSRMEDIFQSGLHEFITSFIEGHLGDPFQFGNDLTTLLIELGITLIKL